MSVSAQVQLNDRGALAVCVTGLSSDSHTWNLIFMQLFLEEMGHRVTNLGPCVPNDEIVEFCSWSGTQLLVISTINGHGIHSAGPLISAVRSRDSLVHLPVVIGGKLGSSGAARPEEIDRMLSAGFHAVFDEGSELSTFVDFVDSLSRGAHSAVA
jgi:methylaspartate mutase sigma subunit